MTEKQETTIACYLRKEWKATQNTVKPPPNRSGHLRKLLNRARKARQKTVEMQP